MKGLFNSELKQKFNDLKKGATHNYTGTFDEEVAAIVSEVQALSKATPAYLSDHKASIDNLVLKLAELDLTLIPVGNLKFAMVAAGENGLYIVPTYHALAAFAYDDDLIKRHETSAVCENDKLFEEVNEFEQSRSFVKHEIGFDALKSRGAVVAAYCNSLYPDGSSTSSVVALDELLNLSAMGDVTYWQTYTQQMSAKTAVRKEAKKWLLKAKKGSRFSRLMSHEHAIGTDEFPNNPIKSSVSSNSSADLKEAYSGKKVTFEDMKEYANDVRKN